MYLTWVTFSIGDLSGKFCPSLMASLSALPGEAELMHCAHTVPYLFTLKSHIFFFPSPEALHVYGL